MAYDYKKTLKKVAVSALYVLIAGVASVYGQNPYFLAVAPALHGLQNMLKHKYDVQWLP